MRPRRRTSRSETTLAETYGDLRADFDAANDSRYMPRLSGVAAMGSGADYHYRSELKFLRMMERARSFDRNNMVVGQAVDRLVNNVLQDGIKLDPQTNSVELNAALAAKWQSWSENAAEVDKAGEHDFYRKAWLTLRAVIVDGDVCHLPLKEGCLQTIEAHRLRTPRRTKRNVVHGVLLDEFRRRIEYWFARDDIDPVRTIQRVSDMEQYPAWDAQGNRSVLHVYNPKRFSQTRGLSALTPVAFPVGMHDDLQFANLLRAQVAACYSIFHKRPLEFMGGADVQRGERTTQSLADGSTRTIEGVAPGMEIFGEPGEELIGFSPNVPNPEFFKHAILILTFIAINLNLPVAVLLLDPSETNFSGWRGAMDQARIGFRFIQRFMVDMFYRPVYLWKVRQWLVTDPEIKGLADEPLRKTAEVDVFAHRWSPPVWQYIEPSKDAAADARIVDSRLNSRRAVLARRGLDLDDVDVETIVDNKRFVLSAIDAAEEINRDHGDAEVDWRELAGFPAKGRKPAARGRAMEDIARAVRSGVPVAVSEARTVGLGLPADPADEYLLRFNDQDVLGYHIEAGVLTINEIRKRLGLKRVKWGNVPVRRDGVTAVEIEESREGQPRDRKTEEESDTEEKK